MTRLTKLFRPVFYMLVSTTVLCAQDVLFQWDLDQPEMKHWRAKSNCTLEHRPDPEGSLRWGTRFGAFNFGWTTRFLPERLDFTEAGCITFRVKGDGSGHLLTLQLGYIEPGKPSTYYVNKSDGILLDFTEWRDVSFQLARFSIPAGHNPLADMEKVAFIEFFLNQVGDSTDVSVEIDDVRVLSATPEQAKAVQGLWNMATRLQNPIDVNDGTNVLPNPGFELDLNQDDGPDFWRWGDWNTGSKAHWDTTIGHSGTACVRIDCATDKQRGSYALNPRVGPGPWVFEAWTRTDAAMQAEPRKGPVARLIAVNDEGKQCGTFHAYGKPGNTDWQLTTVSFDLPLRAHHINLELFGLFAKGSVWWDDVSLRYDREQADKQEAERERQKRHAMEAREAIDPIATAVEALPTETAPQKLKRAALAWAVEDAQASIEAGLGTMAKNELADIDDTLSKDLGRRVTPSEKLMVPMPNFGDNPYVEGVLGRVRSVLTSNALYKKGNAGYAQINNAWSFSSMGSNAYAAVWGLCYPESPNAANPELLVRALRLLQAIFQNHRNGDFNPGREAVHGRDPNINRFCFVPAFEAYLLLEATYPTLLLPGKRTEWLASARVATEYQIETYGIRAKDDPPGCYYANMDVHYMLMLELASRIFDEPRYHAEAETFYRLTADVLYPDGAFSYHGFQNECFGYHQISIAHLARYWQLTGSELARDTIVKSQPYYPYNVEPGGVPEYYTDCFWKHYWSKASPIGPDIVAGMTGCPHNRRIAKDELRWNKPNHYYSIYAGSLYHPEIKDEALPDNFLIYDRNVEGPRGRFGRWSFAGTTRFLGEGCQGKDTFVGGMVVDEPDRQFPLNAALQVVTNQVRLRLQPPDVEKAQRWRDCRYLSQDEHNAVTIGEGFAALTTRYRIQNVAWGGKSTLTEWAGNQQWILTPAGLIGTLEIEPLSDQRAYSIHGRIRFGLSKEIERKDDDLFKYGGLLCKIHEHSYADIITEKSETFYIDKPANFRSTEIVLRDKASLATDGTEQLIYKQGTRQFFTVEVLPYWSTFAKRVRRITTPDGLRGLEVHAGKRWLLLVHNPTEQDATFKASLDWARQGTLLMHTSGNPQSDPKPLVSTDGNVEVSIPPHTHIVLEGPE